LLQGHDLDRIARRLGCAGLFFAITHNISFNINLL
jgi:hypothetical protein